MDFRVSARGGIWNVVRRWRISFLMMYIVSCVLLIEKQISSCLVLRVEEGWRQSQSVTGFLFTPAPSEPGRNEPRPKFNQYTFAPRYFLGSVSRGRVVNLFPLSFLKVL